MGVFDKPEQKPEKPINDNSWYKERRYNILLYGPPKVGKTWAYCSVIEEALNNNKKVFIINTDGGLASTLKGYFENDFEKIAEKINYFFCPTTLDGIKATNQALMNAGPGDWVIVDLISDFWQLAQDEFMKSTGMSPDEYIQLASKNPAKFGLYDGSKWNYIKKLDNMITDTLPKRGKYNILGVCGCKDIEVEKAIAKIKNHEFESVGYRPEGQKTLPHRFESIIFIGGTEKKFFKIIGHRGKKTSNENIPFEKNFWNEFKNHI